VQIEGQTLLMLGEQFTFEGVGVRLLRLCLESCAYKAATWKLVVGLWDVMTKLEANRVTLDNFARKTNSNSDMMVALSIVSMTYEDYA